MPNKLAPLRPQEIIQIKHKLSFNIKLQANIVIFQAQELRAQLLNNLILLLFLSFINLYQEPFGKAKKLFLKKNASIRKSNLKHN